MTENINDKNIDEQTVKRIQAGKAGKLWCITVLAKDGSATRRWCRINLYWDELLKIRESLFKYGLLILTDPGHGLIIPPWDLLDIRVEKQKQIMEYDPTKE